MTKLLTILLASLAMTSMASAKTIHHVNSNSLAAAAIEINAINAPPPSNTTLAAPYSNADEQHNSLARAALAKQGTKTVYLRFNSGTPILYRKPIAAQIISPSAYSFWHRGY